MAYSPPSASTPETSRSLGLDQVARLQEASLSIAASLDSGEVLRRVVAAARTLLAVDAAVLFQRESSRSDFPALASDGLGNEGTVLLSPARPAEIAVGRAITQQQVVGVEDVATARPSDADRRRADGFAERAGFCSVLAAPLTTANVRLGALALYARERRAWSHEDATLLSVFATHAAVALQNARLYERLHQRASDLQALFELSHLFNAFVEREPLLSAVIARLTDWMGAKYGAVMLVERGEEGEAELKIRAHANFNEAYVARANTPGGVSLDPRHPTGNGPASVAVRESRPCAVGDVFLDDRFAPFRLYAHQAGYHALVAVPLCGQGRVAGCIVLYFAQRRDFGQAELQRMGAVADGVALALDRIQLSERLVQEAVERHADAQTDRLKAEFVSTVSHELRTPLTIIKGYTDLVVSEQAGPLSETQRKFLVGVQRNTARLTDLVSDLLDISRLEAEGSVTGEEEVDVARIVADACGEYERVAGERNVGITCLACPGPPMPTVRGDSARILQVVANLLSNAVKYSPGGETVTLDCVDRDGEIVVTVADQGPGIPPEAQGRLFQRFYRVDNSTTRQVGGTGLGLAIAKAIVEQHGGRIWVQSEPGQGSVFGFALPHQQPQQREQEE